MKNIRRIRAGKYQYRRAIIEKKKDGWHYHLIDITASYLKDIAVKTKQEAESGVDRLYKSLGIGRWL